MSIDFNNNSCSSIISKITVAVFAWIVSVIMQAITIVCVGVVVCTILLRYPHLIELFKSVILLLQ